MIQPAGRARNSTYSNFNDPTTFNERPSEMKRSSGLTFQQKMNLTLREKEDLKLKEKYARLENPSAYRNWTEQKTMKSSDLTKDRMFQTAKSILSANGGSRDKNDKVGYEGAYESPIRPLSRANTNSIFDPERIANLKASQEKTNGEKIKAANQKIKEDRELRRLADRNLSIDKDRLLDILKNGPMESARSIAPARGNELPGEYSRKLPSHNFSIFDNGSNRGLEDKLPALTAGEQISANARARRSSKSDHSRAAASERIATNSYESMSRPTNSRQISDQLYQNLKSTLQGYSEKK